MVLPRFFRDVKPTVCKTKFHTSILCVMSLKPVTSGIFTRAMAISPAADVWLPGIIPKINRLLHRIKFNPLGVTLIKISSIYYSRKCRFHNRSHLPRDVRATVLLNGKPTKMRFSSKFRLHWAGLVHADFSQELQQIWNRSTEHLFACRLSLPRVASVLFSPHFVLGLKEDVQKAELYLKVNSTLREGTY